MSSVPRLPLSKVQKQARAFTILFILGFMVYASLITPRYGSEAGWSISAFPGLIGLPCPLCGGTRATHFFLRGDLAGTLYYNWLAIPSVLGGLVLVSIMSWELIKGRIYLPPLPFSKKIIVLGLISALVVWGAHIYDALESPKPELLNSRGLYFRLKSENNSPKAVD